MLTRFAFRKSHLVADINSVSCAKHNTKCNLIWTNKKDTFNIYGLHHNFCATHARFACANRPSQQISLLRYQHYATLQGTKISLHHNEEIYNVLRIRDSFITTELLFFCNESAITHQRYKPSQWRQGVHYILIFYSISQTVFAVSNRNKHDVHAQETNNAAATNTTLFTTRSDAVCGQFNSIFEIARGSIQIVDTDGVGTLCKFSFPLSFYFLCILFSFFFFNMPPICQSICHIPITLSFFMYFVYIFL